MGDPIFQSVLPQRCTIIHRGDTGRGAYNQQVIGEISRDEDIPCRLKQTDSTEVVVGEDTVLTDTDVSIEYGVGLTSIDQVIVEGVTYAVVGRPRVEYDERVPHHIVAHLKAVQ